MIQTRPLKFARSYSSDFVRGLQSFDIGRISTADEKQKMKPRIAALIDRPLDCLFSEISSTWLLDFCLFPFSKLRLLSSSAFGQFLLRSIFCADSLPRLPDSESSTATGLAIFVQARGDENSVFRLCQVRRSCKNNTSGRHKPIFSQRFGEPNSVNESNGEPRLCRSKR